MLGASVDTCGCGRSSVEDDAFHGLLAELDDDEFHGLLAELDDDEFESLWGPLARLRPTGVAESLGGMDAPWWIVGGWAVEACTGEQREHDDVDVCVLSRDVPASVEHFLDTLHVGVAGGRTLRAVLSPSQRLPTWTHQIRVREHATAPWLLDVIVTPDCDGMWVFRRRPDVVEELSEVTWIAADGLQYQRPETTVALEAAFDRPKERLDLDAVVPRLDVAARTWLAVRIARIRPGHPWPDHVRR